ncbi:growth arrest-specific protein 2-like [Clavelina lepadiformis]|uniref:growth arrest-specific protein 2-like n=1 Tax=Clavelina lepadiformis TaxID=159417 RepID=UPI00404120CF
MVAKKRLNISKFLTFCSRVGVRRITLFESEDILLQRNEKQVLNCLLNLSKIFTKYGIEPPEMIKQEIEQEEAKLSSPRKGQRNPEEEITSSRMSQV